MWLPRDVFQLLVHFLGSRLDIPAKYGIIFAAVYISLSGNSLAENNSFFESFESYHLEDPQKDISLCSEANISLEDGSCFRIIKIKAPSGMVFFEFKEVF